MLLAKAIIKIKFLYFYNLFVSTCTKFYNNHYNKMKQLEVKNKLREPAFRFFLAFRSIIVHIQTRGTGGKKPRSRCMLFLLATVFTQRRCRPW